MLVDDRATSSVRSGKSYKYKVKGFDSFCWRWEGQLDDMAPFQNCAPSRTVTQGGTPSAPRTVELTFRSVRSRGPEC